MEFAMRAKRKSEGKRHQLAEEGDPPSPTKDSARQWLANSADWEGVQGPPPRTPEIN